MELKDRFLKYVSFDTQSDESSETFPSTAKQRVLLDYLAVEMKALGLTEGTVDKYGYAMGTIPATPGCEKAPVIGFIAHVDTAPDMSGADVKPHVIENYDGKDIRLNAGVTMKVADFPELSFFKGHTLIHTDGTTLLGADDKAGVAELLPAAEYLAFQGEPFREEDYSGAILAVRHAMRRYDPTVIGFEWDDENTRIQLEPRGIRGYIELRAVKRRNSR